MEGDERLRLFCALLLPADAIAAIVRWQMANLASAPAGLRIVPEGNLHVTLAFLGSVESVELPAIVAVLRRACSGLEPPVLGALRYRETRSVGMIELSDEGGRAEALAARLRDGLERLGLYRREARRWRPHVTVVRFRSRPRLELEPPELAAVRTSDAAVMISRLRRGGARYEIFESVSGG